MAESDPKRETNANGQPNPEDRLLNRLRLPAAGLLVFLLMVGAYYTLHYRQNAEYLANRNFRLLATLGKQVSDAARNEGRVFSNVVGRSAQLDPDALNPRIKLVDCTVTEKDPPDQTTGENKDQVKIWRSLGSSDGAYRLFFQSQRTAENGTLAACGEVELQALLDPLFSSREAFDAVMLANGDGKVVYLHGPKSLQVQQLDLLIQNRHSAKAEPEKGQEGGFDAFQGYSGSAEVKLGDRLYTIFVQPFSLPLAFAETDPAGKPGKRPHDVWLLAGLVATDELAAKRLALSPSAVAFLLGVLLLAALAWPLAKLKLLGERQRVKKSDVLLVGVCSLLGVSVATLFILDLGAYRTLKRSSEMQLKSFAEQMESNLMVEVRRAYDQLRQFDPGPSPTEDCLPEASYPHFESYALIDDKGQQVYRWSPASDNVADSKSVRINVADRMYFQRVHQGRTLNIPGLEQEILGCGSEPFFLESVQSWTNGEWQAVIAKPVTAPTILPAQVAALAIQMLSVIKPVMPPDFEYAVVGDDGTVLFHSDSARNLAENFFEETDQNRRFKSIVLARHDEPLDVRYWGESYRAYAIPVKGLPWTIVAMRNEQVLERVNLDWLVTTLILVLLYMAAISLTLTAVSLLRPGYRAGWVWPDPERCHDYAKLVAILGAFCLAFLIALLGLRGTGFIFYVAALLPMLSLIAVYLKLSPAENRSTKKRAIVACGMVLLALLGLVLRAAPLENGAGAWVKWAVFALVAVACLLAADGPRGWRELPAGKRLPVSRSYPALGLLLILLAAVLPTAGFFKVAHRLQVNSFVRNGQLRIAKELHERIALLKASPDPASAVSELTVGRSLIDDHLGDYLLGLDQRQMNTHPKRKKVLSEQVDQLKARGLVNPQLVALALRSKPNLDFYGGAFFNTALSLPGRCAGEVEAFEPLAALLPPYSDYTAENREMLHNHTSDDDWSWCETEDGDTVFDGENYLGVSLASRVEPIWRGNGPLLEMAGLLPPPEPTDLVEETNRDPVAPRPPEAGSLGMEELVRAITALSLLSLFGILLYGLVMFVARRIFLLDVQEPLWAGAEGTLAPAAGRNLFLVRKNLMPEALASEMGFEYLHLGQIDEGEIWVKRCQELVDSERNLMVAGFEHRIFDPAFNARKMELLTRLLEIRERSVIVLSQVSPSRLFASEPADDARPAAVNASRPPYDDWRTVLAAFTVIEEDLRSRPAVSVDIGNFWSELLRSILRRRGLLPPTSEHFVIKSRVLREESGCDPFLGQIARDIDFGRYGMNREQLLEEFGERAQGYYGALWASCADDERIVLGHLAEEGLVNAKNRRAVRRLMARGLIRRAPNLCLMNETFRRFVASPVCRDKVSRLEQRAGRSAWDRFHWPFSAALASCAALILVTQQELLDSTVAAVTGVTAGLPTLLKIFDLLGWKRGVKSG